MRMNAHTFKREFRVIGWGAGGSKDQWRDDEVLHFL
jgi:hypothetical protein